jgi:hypothetical protein
MKTTKVYDVTNKHDLKKMIDMNKLSTKEGAVKMLKHLTVYDLYIAACSNMHFTDVLENLGREARKMLVKQANEVATLAKRSTNA